MRFKKTIRIVLSLGVLLLSLIACQNFKKTQLVLFDSLFFNMSTKSFEEVFEEADKVEEETAMGYHDTWHARDPYFYKTGRLFYHYENIALNGYTGRADFTFSKSHRLEEVTVHIPVASKMEQQVALYNLSQTIKKEIEALPTFKSVTTETVGLYDDGYRYKVKLRGERRELWIDVYPIENEYTEKNEGYKYRIRIDQFLMYP
ncbi:hypothetical protein QM415_02825 [Streptococcus peroris]|uniref:hypothetical protein n=1 Tax=Streptococcus TaxID=1301 RepID=UPI0008AA0C1B|nr:hypothetical protein [Streptococcus sp. HMSC34B10]OHS88105.1 hypothetical protein HMPREF3237_00800 [Streptococcus sp. HMSC34B10]